MSRVQKNSSVFSICMAVIWLVVVPDVRAQTLQPEGSADESKVLTVRHMAYQSQFSHTTVQWKILELALQKSGRVYDLGSSSVSRAGRLVDVQLKELGDEGNVIWGDASPSLEEKMRSVTVPIFGGIDSYWNIWVRKDDKHRFAHVKSIEDLNEFSVIHAKPWSSTAVLEDAGFTIVSGRFKNMLKMLASGRADFYLYPAIKRQNIVERNAEELGLTTLTDLMVRLPIAQYFYVDESSNELHDVLFRGLNEAIVDGSLEKMLRSDPVTGEVFELMSKEGLLVLELDNPGLTKVTQDALEKYALDIM